MKYAHLTMMALALLTLAACSRQPEPAMPPPAVAGPGPPGPTGATGETGATGQAGSGTTVIVVPPAASAASS